MDKRSKELTRDMFIDGKISASNYRVTMYLFSTLKNSLRFVEQRTKKSDVSYIHEAHTIQVGSQLI